MEELNGERVDMIEWSDDPIRLISTALQPAAISAVIIVNDEEGIDEEGRRIKKRAAVFVEEAQRPMAIGKKGQNIRLATELSGFELDMYNYEELPAFKAKLAELAGSENIRMEEMTPEQPEESSGKPTSIKKVEKASAKEEKAEEKEEKVEDKVEDKVEEKEVEEAPAEEEVKEEEVPKEEVAEPEEEKEEIAEKKEEEEKKE